MGDVLRVLIVDDSEPSRYRISQKIKHPNITIVGEASNGVHALELISIESPDVVLMDIIMPEMDGVECYLNLLKKKSPPACIFITSLAEEARFLEAYKDTIPVNLYLSKGFTVEELFAKLDEVLGWTPNKVIQEGSAS